MIDFSELLKYFTLNTVSELLCLFASITCLWKDKNTAWRSMILFLLITCVTELTGIYIKIHATTYSGKFNTSIYNVLTFFEIAFISLMFNALLKKYVNSKPILIGGFVIFLLVYVFELAYSSPKQKDIVTTIVISLIFVIYSLYYYYYLLKSDTYVTISTFASFWWVAGVLLFYFGVTSCNLFYSMLLTNKSSQQHTAQLHYIKYIYRALNIILYSCWSYSFICRRWLTKSET
jgi:hypothetical protein